VHVHRLVVGGLSRPARSHPAGPGRTAERGTLTPMRVLLALLATSCTLTALPAAAHHSFAIYDMSKNIEFEGVVDVVKLRNPHMAMTLVQTKADGSKETINFVE